MSDCAGPYIEPEPEYSIVFRDSEFIAFATVFRKVLASWAWATAGSAARKLTSPNTATSFLTIFPPLRYELPSIFIAPNRGFLQDSTRLQAALRALRAPLRRNGFVRKIISI